MSTDQIMFDEASAKIRPTLERIRQAAGSVYDARERGAPITARTMANAVATLELVAEGLERAAE